MMMMDPNAPVNVEIAVTEYRDVPQDETYTTTVQAYAVNNVVPQAGSRIKKINVEVGDFVSKGQILAEMDQTSLEQTKLKLDNDALELSRLKELYEAGALSKSDYEAMQLSYNVSNSQYQNLVENTILRSPLTGVITARNYDVGDMYAMSSPIYVVQQITPVKLLVAMSETDYSKVKKGDSVDITADAIPGRTFVGKVNRIYPVIDPASHTFTAEVVVPNQGPPPRHVRPCQSHLRHQPQHRGSGHRRRQAAGLRTEVRLRAERRQYRLQPHRHAWTSYRFGLRDPGRPRRRREDRHQGTYLAPQRFRSQCNQLVEEHL